MMAFNTSEAADDDSNVSSSAAACCWFAGTFAYESDGTFWDHDVEDALQSSHGHWFITGKPPFGVGDVRNKRNQSIAGFTLDLLPDKCPLVAVLDFQRERWDTTGMFVNPADIADLFPCVTLRFSFDKLEANFGRISNGTLPDDI
uniref:Uncharacterized protein n=1 Tax=Globodera rostochiensis TaxID=31243 RepID=A0A914IGW2_GLORO